MFVGVRMGEVFALAREFIYWRRRLAARGRQKDRRRLLGFFLDKHAAAMPRTMLRYAIEHLDKDERTHYMGMKDDSRRP